MPTHVFIYSSFIGIDVHINLMYIDILSSSLKSQTSDLIIKQSVCACLTAAAATTLALNIYVCVLFAMPHCFILCLSYKMYTLYIVQHIMYII